MILETAIALTLAAQPATYPAATAPPDARASLWFGCWQPDRIARADGEPVRLCVVPDGTSIRLLSVDGTRIVAELRLTLDGTARPVTDLDCVGTETARWAASITGYFRRASLTCGGDVKTRAIDSLAFIRDDGRLVSIEAIEVEGGLRVRPTVFRRASDQRLPDGVPRVLARAATAGGVSWTVAQLIEAHAALPADAVEAALTQLVVPVELEKKQLLALADAGVSEGIIDLAIALAYPDRFVVRHAGGGWAAPFGTSGDTCGGDVDASRGLAGCAAFEVRSFGWPFYSGSAWGMLPYGGFYGDYGYFPYYYQQGYVDGAWVPGWPSAPGYGNLENSPYTVGRVVNGQGYTRVSERGSTTVAGQSGGGESGSGSGSSSGSSSGGSVSSGGYSSGGAGGGDRTAVGRPPGQ